jgi:acetyltransferase-like isoleucine patch superfamily enzyme
VNGVSAYSRLRDVRDSLFTRLAASAFAEFGSRSRLALPIQLEGADRIAIGSDVYIGPGGWLLALEPDARLEIGDGSTMSGYCVVSAAVSVRLGRKVMLGRNVYVADHGHGFQEDRPIIDQPIDNRRPVTLEDGAWLGQNVVVLPGVTIGRNAVIGANSVVREDVPPRSVAAGSPARVLTQL